MKEDFKSNQQPQPLANLAPDFANGAQKENKDPTPLSTEGQIVIEEKQVKPNGEVNIIQYIRGNFLGKVF